MENSKISIETYFFDNKNETFVIPEYQRGYKWSVKDGKDKSSLEVFIDSLVTAFKSRLNEYFIEAVTIVEDEEVRKIILVDGQQRTTSLFLLLKELGETDSLKDKLKYDVREDSHNWLNNQISNDKVHIEDEDVQDIFYFKEAIIQIKNSINEIDKVSFIEFIKKNIFLLCNKIDEEKAINTFIALNGLKAVMKDEELIKSDLLIKSSRIELLIPADKDELFGLEWKVNEDRGRLARNWDKWLYWWNQDEVKEYFVISKSQHPLYYLLVTYWNINKEIGEEKGFSFDNFKAQFISDVKNAKSNFEGLRKLQKTFEDLYNDWEAYNVLGLALNSSLNKNDCLKFFILNREKKEELKRFVKWCLAGCTIVEIQVNSEIEYTEKRADLKDKLQDPNLYNEEGKDQVYLQLLRMNVMDMNKRKFDFSVFKTKSLEHICPQNPTLDNQDFISSQDEINTKSDGINSIGNLVLLNGSANSSLSNSPLNRKKQLLFDKIKEGFLLPHTLKVFSKSFSSDNNEKNLFDTYQYWTSDDVINNKEYFLKEFDTYHGK